MHYIKLKSGDTIIEFHNNWLGQETIIVNGHPVSKKGSVWGTNHYFTVMEEGHSARYILTTRMNSNMGVSVDLIRNGILLIENQEVKGGTLPGKRVNKPKKQGLVYLNKYDLVHALEQFKLALDFDIKDPEIHFHMACCYSIMEKTNAGFEALKNAVAHNLQDTESIFNHDLLAFLRLHDAFEGFVNSGFTTYYIDTPDEEE